MATRSAAATTTRSTCPTPSCGTSCFPPFRAAVEAGAGNVMTGYMDLNGIPATGNRWLFTEVLRDTLGFEGFVVSDANAVRNLLTHGFAADLTDAGARAVNAGVDLEMAISDPAYAHLPEALDSGATDIATIDASVRRILEAKIRMGLFDDPYVDEARARQVLADPAHRDVARVAAERSAVLLRNEGDGCCPSTADGARLGRGHRAAGRLATRHHRALGLRLRPGRDGHRARRHPRPGRRRRPGRVRPRGAGRAARVPVAVRHVRREHARRTPRGSTRTPSSSGPSTSPRGADVAVVVVGEWQNMIGEMASRSSLELPGRQLELLQAVVATGTPVVLLVMNGRPLDLRWAAENVPAILDIWYPGTQGGAAVANLLFGDVSPGGKLPFTWPRTVGQVPMTYAHTISHEPENQARRYWDEASTPLFPFGYGLSYGRFTYTNLTVDEPATTTDGTVTVSVEVTNTGDREADEVVQLYLHQRHGTASRPVRELKGFQRVTLAAGESRTLSVPGRSGRAALLERRRPRLGDRHLDLRRVGRG